MPKKIKENSIIEFALTYGWIIAVAIIVILILAYFIKTSPSMGNYYDCLGKNYCNDLGMDYNKINFDTSNVIVCERSINNFSKINFNLVIVNETGLRNQYPNCLKGVNPDLVR